MASRRSVPAILLRAFCALAAAFLFANCGLVHAVRRSPHFAVTPDPKVDNPPLGGLLVWLEGGPSIETDRAGRVTRWRDGLHSGRAAVPQFGFQGTLATATVPTPSGPRVVRGLRCAEPPSRCAYAIRDAGQARPPVTLSETSYSILAVVQRASFRGDNYFVMTSGSGCGVFGTGCASNSVLHLGWVDSSRIRHGHYDNDVDLPVRRVVEVGTPFPMSLVVAQSGPLFMDAALLDDWFHTHNSRPDPGPLSDSGELLIGGTPFDVYPAPDWHFEGDLFALLVYGRELTDAERRTAEDYLRNAFGPR